MTLSAPSVSGRTRGRGPFPSPGPTLRRVLNRLRPQSFAAYVTVAFVAGLVIYPMLFLLSVSLDVSPQSRAGGAIIPREFGLDNFAALFQTPTLVLNTLKVAALATVIALPCGLLASWVLFRAGVRFSGFLEQLLTLPYYVTPLVGALAWSVLASPRSGLINQLWVGLGQQGPLVNGNSVLGVAIAMAFFEGAVAFVMISAAMKSMDPALEEAARMTGAGTGRILRTITIPLLRPVIVGTAIFVFAEMFGAFAAPLVLGAPARFYVLTTAIYQAVNSYPPNYPRAAAMGLVLFLVLGVLLLVQSRLTRGSHFVTISGKAFRQRDAQVSPRARRGLLAGIIIYGFVVAVLPLLALVVTSFQRVATGKITDATWTGINYKQAFTLDVVTSGLRNSIILGLLTASSGVVLMGFIAWLLARAQLPRPVARVVETVTMLPLAVPRVVFGLGLLWAWLLFPLRLYGTLWLLWIAYLTVLLPLGVRTFSSVIVQLDRSLEECARVCGAGRFRQLRTVTGPLLKPGMIAAWVLLFLASVRELGASLFLSGPRSPVIAPAIIQSWASSGSELTAAMTIIQTVAVCLVLAVILLVTRLLLRRRRSPSRAEAEGRDHG